MLWIERSWSDWVALLLSACHASMNAAKCLHSSDVLVITSTMATMLPPTTCTSIILLSTARALESSPTYACMSKVSTVASIVWLNSSL